MPLQSADNISDFESTKKKKMSRKCWSGKFSWPMDISCNVTIHFITYVYGCQIIITYMFVINSKIGIKNSKLRYET